MTEGLVLGGEGKDIQKIEDMLAAYRFMPGVFEIHLGVLFLFNFLKKSFFFLLSYAYHTLFPKS